MGQQADGRSGTLKSCSPTLFSTPIRTLTPRFYGVRGMVVRSEAGYLKCGLLCICNHYQLLRVGTTLGKIRASLLHSGRGLHSPPQGLEHVSPREVITQAWTRWRANDGVSVVSTPTNVYSGRELSSGQGKRENRTGFMAIDKMKAHPRLGSTFFLGP